MSDPLRDERFPDRPQTPDFWRMVDVVNKLDGDATEGGKSMPEILAGLVDTASLMYMAEQKSVQARKTLAWQARHLVPALETPELAVAIQGLWMNAFAAGALFQREGGHRE